MTWIVKSGKWYYNDGCWFRKQKMAERFFDRCVAEVAAVLSVFDGYVDARIVKLVQAPTYVVKYKTAERWVARLHETDYPNFYGTMIPDEAVTWERSAAEEFVADWNEKYPNPDFELECLPS